jgi:hypothetical protein
MYLQHRQRNIISGTFRAAAICLLCSPAFAVTIDFTNSPSGTLAPFTNISNQYASSGVTFSSVENGTATLPRLWTDSRFTDNGLINDYSHPTLGYGRADIVLISFSTPVSGLGFLFNTFEHTGLEVPSFRAYDASNTLVETHTVFATNQLWYSLAFVAPEISRIEGHQYGDFSVWGIDNLQFEAITAPVPEKGQAILLFGISSVGLLILQRRFAERVGSMLARMPLPEDLSSAI